MPALLDVDDLRVVDDRPDIAVFLSRLGKGEQAVELGQQRGVDLNLRDELLHRQHQFAEELLFHREDFVLRTQDFLFILLQFLRDVAFGLGQRLLAHPISGYVVLIRIAHFQIISEDVVIAYLQRLNTRLPGLALLNLQ